MAAGPRVPRATPARTAPAQAAVAPPGARIAGASASISRPTRSTAGRATRLAPRMKGAKGGRAPARLPVPCAPVSAPTSRRRWRTAARVVTLAPRASRAAPAGVSRVALRRCRTATATASISRATPRLVGPVKRPARGPRSATRDAANARMAPITRSAEALASTCARKLLTAAGAATRALPVCAA
jgi:hypothetical protein